MTEFTGVVYPRLEPTRRIDVTAELLRGFIILRMPENQWLGSWTAAELLKAHVSGCRFKLTIKSANVFFDVENPLRFLELLQDSDLAEDKPRRWSRSKSRGSSPTDQAEAPESLQRTHEKLAADTTAKLTPETSDEVSRPNLAKVANHDLQTAITEYQLDVVEWLEAGMASWFDFYFRLGPTGLHDRLEQAAVGMEKAVLQLNSVSEQLEHLRLGSEQHDLVAEYAKGLRIWSSALEQIAVGCRMDQHKPALDGFTRMDEGTLVIEKLLERLPRYPRLRVVTNALAHLDALLPESSVSAKTIARAKGPWRRALLAAGWARTDSRVKRPFSSAARRFRRDIASWQT